MIRGLLAMGFVSRITLSLLLILAVFLGVSARTACAQSEPRVRTAEERRALELFKQSERSYRAGRFEEAAALLRQAFEIHPLPLLLYNLARALENTGDLEGAIQAYSLYLDRERKLPDRAAITEHVASLRRQVEERKTLEHAAPTQQSPPGPPPAAALLAVPAVERPAAAPAVERSSAPPILLGVGTAALVSGVVLGLLAADQNDDAKREPIQTRAQATADGARSLATAANVAFVAGGLCAATGLVWLLLDRRSHDRAPPHAEVGLRFYGAGVALAGRW
jgi:tetratricopeptide (TPR) repeat protein